MDSFTGFAFLLVGFTFVAYAAVRNRPIATPILVAFAVRVVALLVDVFFFPLPGAGDGIGWDRVATYWAKDGVGGTLQYVNLGHRFYVWLMSVLYAIFGRSRFMIQAINVTLGTMMLVSAAQIARRLSNDDKVARQVAWIIALFPSLICFSAILMREVAVAYPLTVAVLYLTRWHYDRRPTQLLFALMMLLLSMSFHSGAAAVLVVAGLWLGVNWLRNVVTMRFDHIGRNTIALVVGVAAIAAVLSSGFGLYKFQGLEEGGLAALSGRQDGFSHGRAVYLQDLRADTPMDVVVQAPLRLVYFLFAPFPWMLSEVSDLFGFIDSTLFLYLVLRAVARRKSLRASPAIVLVLGIVGTMAMTFAAGVSNYGTALRHRNKMLPILIAASAAIPSARRRKQLEEQAAPRQPQPQLLRS
jgi:hypothetical protein